MSGLLHYTNLYSFLDELTLESLRHILQLDTLKYSIHNVLIS